MAEDSQDTSEIISPDTFIKDSSIQAHTLAAENIRKDMSGSQLSDLSRSDVPDLAIQAEQHDEAAKIIERDQRSSRKVSTDSPADLSKEPTRPITKQDITPPSDN